MASSRKHRWPIWLAGSALAAVMALAAASNVVMRKDPGLALQLFPLNAEALAREADADFMTSLNAQLREQTAGQAGRLTAPPPGEARRAMAKATIKARRSLAGQPLNPRALRILALADPESERASALLKASDVQSRRDTLTQVYLIERAARGGNIGEAMRHYDALLRRRSGIRDHAGRNLASALAYPAILEYVAEQLLANPPWESLLYHYAVQTPESYGGFLQLHRMLQGRDAIPIETSAKFAAALAARGRIDDAIEIAKLVGAQPLARTRSFVERDFASDPPFPGTWAALDDTLGYLQPLSGSGAVLSLSSGTVGPVVRRLVALEPGRYRSAIAIEEQTDGFNSQRGSAPIEARLKCVTDNPRDMGATDITISPDCPYQWLSIHLTEPQLRAEDIVIDAITITQKN